MSFSNVKFAPPQIATEAVKRTELATDLLNNDYRLVICQAPAGYGKTVAMADYFANLQATGHKCAWLSLDTTDNDFDRFFELIKRSTHAAQAPTIIGDSNTAPQSDEDIWEWLTTAMVDQNAVSHLFLDDFEVISDPTILETLSMAFQRLPSPRQIVMCTRSRPQFKYSNLRLNGLVKYIDTDALRFSNDEAERFFQLNQLELGLQDSRDTLLRQLNGWPTAFQACALQLKHGQTLASVIERSPHQELLSEYILENIVEPLDQSLKDFLLKTSVLNRLNAPMCEALSGNHKAQEVLEKLYTDGLFVQQLTTNPPQYRYHKLFLETLYQALEQTHPQRLIDLHQQACDYLLSTTNTHRAIEHALRAKNTNQAAELIEKEAMKAIYRSEMNEVVNWSTQLPETVIAQSPNLLLACAWAHNFSHNFGSARNYFEKLESYQHQHGLEDSLNHHLSSLKVFYYFLTEQFGQIEKTAYLALKQLPVDAYYDRAACANCLSYTYILQNKLESSRQILMSTQGIELNSTTYFALMCNYTVQIVNQVVQGEFEHAEDRLQQAQVLAQRIGNDDAVAQSFHIPIAATLLYEFGDIDKTVDLLERHLSVIRNYHPNDWLLLFQQ